MLTKFSEVKALAKLSWLDPGLLVWAGDLFSNPARYAMVSEDVRKARS